mmetsp:Transcript_10604/g.17815  ORF Transcript_10604/g.17815 Transcript_10604/m.17815 type:complete len:251 (-) Transcript_10604:78-830(-)
MVAVTIIEPLQTVLETGYRKGVKALVDWAEALYSKQEFVNALGKITMCAKPMKPVCLPDPVKEVKKEAKKEQPKKEEKVEPKKTEKPKDNVESLPPSPFNLYDFKTLFINHPDKKGEGVKVFYEMLDWEGWSFWFFHYDKYEGEGVKLHVTNNLMNGFLSRAEHTAKYSFGRHAVLGEEPELEIMGVWLVRGQEIPDGLAKEHPQFEYVKTRKLNPKAVAADDKLVREFFGGKDGDLMNGLKAQTLRWHK